MQTSCKVTDINFAIIACNLLPEKDMRLKKLILTTCLSLSFSSKILTPEKTFRASALSLGRLLTSSSNASTRTSYAPSLQPFGLSLERTLTSAGLLTSSSKGFMHNLLDAAVEDGTLIPGDTGQVTVADEGVADECALVVTDEGSVVSDSTDDEALGDEYLAIDNLVLAIGESFITGERFIAEREKNLPRLAACVEKILLVSIQEELVTFDDDDDLDIFPDEGSAVPTGEGCEDGSALVAIDEGSLANVDKRLVDVLMTVDEDFVVVVTVTDSPLTGDDCFMAALAIPVTLTDEATAATAKGSESDGKAIDGVLSLTDTTSCVVTADEGILVEKEEGILVVMDEGLSAAVKEILLPGLLVLAVAVYEGLLTTDEILTCEELIGSDGRFKG